LDELDFHLTVTKIKISPGTPVVGLALTAFALRLLAPMIEERLGRPVPGGTNDLAAILFGGQAESR
jgi:hypothetical protein